MQGLYVSGVIGDRMNLRYVLCFGLCGSATVVSYRVNPSVDKLTMYGGASVRALIEENGLEWEEHCMLVDGVPSV